MAWDPVGRKSPLVLSSYTLPGMTVNLLDVERTRRFRQAGWVYGLLGVTIMALTVATPALAGPERRIDLIHLLIGLPFFLVFALSIAKGDRAVAALLRFFGVSMERARLWGQTCQTGLTMLLTLSAVGRVLMFAGNGVGQRPQVSLRPLGFTLEATTGEPRMLLCAALMSVIVVFLARASWVPVVKKRRFPCVVPKI